MKLLILFLIPVLYFTSCTKPRVAQNRITDSKPLGYIDSLSNEECNHLPKP